MPRPVVLALLVGTLAVSACGDDEEKTAAPPPATATPSATGTVAPKKPSVRVPKVRPPKRLIVKDLREGTGEAARPGQTVTVQYVGVNYRGGKQFDASWDRGQPFSFQLGTGHVIPGWDKGVVGMRPGGRRELIVPPSLGCGPQGQPPVIKPNETNRK